MKRNSSVLNNLRVASPCSQDWETMRGDDRKRFCHECKLNVYNISEMTRNEAERFLQNSEGRLCVRYFQRADGTILTKDCPVGWQAVKKRASRLTAAAFAFLTSFTGGLFAPQFFQSRSAAPTMGAVAVVSPQEPEMLMGDISVNTPENNATSEKNVSPRRKRNKR